VLVVGMVLVFLFVPDQHRSGWVIGFGVIGALATIVIVTQTFYQFNFFGSAFWQEYTSLIITAVLVIAAIIAAVMWMSNDSSSGNGEQGEGGVLTFNPLRNK